MHETNICCNTCRDVLQRCAFSPSVRNNARAVCTWAIMALIQSPQLFTFFSFCPGRSRAVRIWRNIRPVPRLGVRAAKTVVPATAVHITAHPVSAITIAESAMIAIELTSVRNMIVTTSTTPIFPVAGLRRGFRTQKQFRDDLPSP